MTEWKDTSPILQSGGSSLRSYGRTNDGQAKTKHMEEDSDKSSGASQSITYRHLLVWPACFIFISAYNMTFNTFGQYVYIKLQNENFPGLRINKTTAFCEVNTSSLNFLIQMDVQQKAATWGIYFYLAGGIASIVSNFVFGAYTDRFGRKFLFVIPCIGTLLRTVAVIMGIHFDLSLHYYIPWFFVEGCTGQIFNIFQISYLYVADITIPGKQRSLGIVVIELAIGLGSALPALLVGYILESTESFLVPYYISVALIVLSLTLMITLPETFPKEIRNERKYSSAFENLKDAADLFCGKVNKGRRWMYGITLLAFMFTTYNAFGRLAMEGLYLLNYPFCWNPTKLGEFGSLRMLFQQVVGMGMVKLLQKCMNDEMIAIAGCVSYAASFILEAYSTNDSMMYLVTIVGTIGLLTLPMIRSIMSQMTSPQKQGAVFASISAAESAISLISAVSSSTTYIATIKIYRGFTFLVFAAFSIISLILLVGFLIGSKRSKHSVRYKVPETDQEYKHHDNTGVQYDRIVPNALTAETVDVYGRDFARATIRVRRNTPKNPKELKTPTKPLRTKKTPKKA